MIVDALLVFGASFLFVFALGLQQLNVAGNHTWLAFNTGILIGATQLVQFKILPGPTGPVANTFYMLGGAIGVVASMRAHPAFVRWLGAWRLRRRAQSPDALCARIDALGDRLRLALAIAGPAAVSDIERFCPVAVMNGLEWFDTARAGDDHAEILPENEFEVAAVAIAVRFLDTGSRLIHHPTLHALVRFKP